MINSHHLTQKLINNLGKFPLSSSDKLVLIYLVSCYNPKKEYVFPKQSTIIEKTGVSQSVVTESIAKLKKLNLITITRKFTNLYKLNLPILCEYLNINYLNPAVNCRNSGLELPDSGTSNITDKEHIKEQGFNKKNFDKKISVPIMNSPSVDKTKELLQEYKDMQLTSDYTNWDRDTAVNHLRRGIPRAFLKRSVVAKYLIEKFNITSDEYVSNDIHNTI